MEEEGTLLGYLETGGFHDYRGDLKTEKKKVIREFTPIFTNQFYVNYLREVYSTNEYIEFYIILVWKSEVIIFADIMVY